MRMQLSSLLCSQLLRGSKSSPSCVTWLKQFGLIGCVVLLIILLGSSESRSDTNTTEPAPAVDGDQTTFISADAVLTLTLPKGWSEAKPDFEDMAIKSQSVDGLVISVLSRPTADVVNFAAWAINLHDYYLSLDKDAEATDGTRLSIGGLPAMRYDVTYSDGVQRWGMVQVFTETPSRCNMLVIQGPLSTFSRAKDTWAALAGGLHENPTAPRPGRSSVSQPITDEAKTEIASNDGTLTLSLPSEWKKMKPTTSWNIQSVASKHRKIRVFSRPKEDFVGDLGAAAERGHERFMEHFKNAQSSQAEKSNLAGSPIIRYDITFDYNDYHWGVVQIFTETSSRYNEVEIQGPISL